ncbi:TPA: integrase [bacterium]|nr:integrase [bacterium]
MDYRLDHSSATDEEVARIEGFFGGLLERGRNQRTIYSYIKDWEKFARWFSETNGEKFDIRRISSLDVRDFKGYLTQKRQRPATINRVLVFLKRYVGYAYEEGLIKGEIYRNIKEIPYVRTQLLAPRSLEQREVRRFLKEVELRASLRDKAIIYLMLYAGLREGELVKLSMDDIELSERKGTVTVRGKGDKIREVPLSLEVRRRLEVYLKKREEGMDSKKKIERVFVGERGPIQEEAVVKIVKKYGGFAQLEISPHILRHTFAYNYLENNEGDLVGLADILGHRNLETTRIYTRKRLSDLQERVERVGFYNRGEE